MEGTTYYNPIVIDDEDETLGTYANPIIIEDDTESEFDNNTDRENESEFYSECSGVSYSRSLSPVYQENELDNFDFNCELFLLDLDDN